MVFELGMGLKTGHGVSADTDMFPGEKQMSEKGWRRPKKKVRRILDHCYRQAQKEVSENIIALYELSAA